jgi:ParB-like chromosome segregation protein Spo0J
VNLVHGGPDVVEELNFDDGLHAARGVADGAADDVGLGERRVEDALGAELGLQAGGELEDAALAFDLGERSSRLASATSSP